MEPLDNKQPTKSRDPERTRSALLDAGLRSFAERGFAGSTVDQIARRARVNKALISYYFGGKRGLLDAIHAEAFGVLEPELEALVNSKASATEDLRAFIHAFGALAEVHADYPVMLLRGLMEGQADPDGEFATHALGLKRTLTCILRKGTMSGSFRQADPLLTQISILGSLLFFFATARSRQRMAESGMLGSSAPSTEAFVEHLQELMSRGLAEGPGNPD